MPGNRSLDEFAGGETGETRSPEEATAEVATDSTAEAVDPVTVDNPDPGVEPTVEAGDTDEAEADVEDSTIEPMAETYAWSGIGETCGRCGATVESRWRDDGELVCDDCKAW